MAITTELTRRCPKNESEKMPKYNVPTIIPLIKVIVEDLSRSLGIFSKLF